MLPLAPRLEREGDSGECILKAISRVGLVCKPNNCNGKLGYNYKVVLVYLSGGYHEPYTAFIFSPETQKWTESVVQTPLLQSEMFCYVHPWNNGGVVSCTGVLHWLSDIEPSYRCATVAFDPFTGAGDKNQWVLSTRLPIPTLYLNLKYGS